MKTIDMSAVLRKLSENKYVLLMLVLGIVLLILPSSVKSDSDDTVSYAAKSSISDSAGRDGEMLGRILAQIDGVGETEVLLSEFGAVVVCDGASSAEIKLYVVKAVSAYTGFGSDKICVLQRK